MKLLKFITCPFNFTFNITINIYKNTKEKLTQLFGKGKATFKIKASASGEKKEENQE